MANRKTAKKKHKQEQKKQQALFADETYSFNIDEILDKQIEERLKNAK